MSLDLIGFNQDVSDPADDLTEEERLDRWEPADAHDMALTADVVLFRGGGCAPGTGSRLPDELDVPVPEECRSSEFTTGTGCPHSSGIGSSSIKTAKEASLSDVNSLLNPSSGRLFDLVNPSELPRLIIDVVISLSWLTRSEPLGALVPDAAA